MQDEKISVIIPVHNAAATLDRAVQSVLQQTIRKKLSIELILVDDGSTDESGDLCREYKTNEMERIGGKSFGGDGAECNVYGLERTSVKSAPDLEAKGNTAEEGLKPIHVKVICMEDEGVSEARNRGLELAEGSYITFLDADDAMDAKMLECLYALHERTGAEICGCSFQSIPAAELVTRQDGDRCASGMAGESKAQRTGIRGTDSGTERCAAANADEESLEEHENVNLLCGTGIVRDGILQRDTRVWSKLFTRSVIGEHRFRKGLTIGEDMLFVLSLIERETTYVSVPEKGYLYTVNPQGAMERPFTPSFMDQIRCWEEAENILRENLPELLEDWAAMGRLRSLQIVSDVLTASKIAKLPKNERDSYGEQFEQCRKALARHRKSGSASGIPTDYRIKSFLLSYMPGVFRAIYQIPQTL